MKNTIAIVAFLFTNFAYGYMSFPSMDTYTYEAAVISFVEANTDFDAVRANPVKICGQKKAYVAYDFDSNTRLSGLFVTQNASATVDGSDVEVKYVKMDTSGPYRTLSAKVNCASL